MEQTLEASANSDDPYADIDFDADVIRAMIMWLIQQKKIQLTSDDFMTALIQALTETTTHAAISQYADYADYEDDDDPFGDNDFDDDDENTDGEDDGYDAEIEKALADVKNDPEFEEKAIDFSSPQTQSLLDLLSRFIESSTWGRLPEKVQDPDLLTMLVLLIMQSNKVMFNHEIKAWTKEELSTTLTFILSDKEIIKVNQRKPVLQALAAFIRSTANKGLWSAKQVKNFAEAVDEKIKALAPESSTPEVKAKKITNRQLAELSR
ncbi:hypothetical protein [Lacticaseibacillus rhamnosus]|uniref:hypothetical protein n=1 Tax=Lacticaseibacillus rhamnosus TaxID=47715 RepID=UPI000AA4BD95|nr:hypothetical protein [Lacticaseibacillus rhamnosus]